MYNQHNQPKIWFMATSATAVWHALAVSVPFTAGALRIFDLGQSAGK